MTLSVSVFGFGFFFVIKYEPCHYLTSFSKHFILGMVTVDLGNTVCEAGIHPGCGTPVNQNNLCQRIHPLVGF